MFSKKDESQGGLFSKLTAKKKVADDGPDNLASKAMSNNNSQLQMAREGSNPMLPAIGADTSHNNLAARNTHAKSKSVMMTEEGNIKWTGDSDSPAPERKKSVVGAIFSSLRRSKSSTKSTSQLIPDNVPLPTSSNTQLNSHINKESSNTSIAAATQNSQHQSTHNTEKVSEYSGRISVSSRHQTKSSHSINETPIDAPVPAIPASVLTRNKSTASMKKSTTSLHSQDTSSHGEVFKADQTPMPKKSIFGQKFDFLAKPDHPDAVEPSEPTALSKDTAKSFTKSMPKISLFGRKTSWWGGSSGGLNIDNSMAGLTADKKSAGLSAYEISNTQVQRSYTLDDFHIVRKVGKGGFATVFLVRMKASTGRYYALKAIKKADLIKLKQEKQVINEKAILKNIKHNFIVELYHSFQDTHYLYMIIEYIDGGDLFSYLRKVQKFGEEDGDSILVRYSLLYKYPLDTTGHVKLADFGFAKVVTTTTNSFCGTPDYIAREIVRNRAYTKAVDWWSFGVLIFELVSGKTPFGDDSSEQIYENITEMKIKWHPMIKGTTKDIVKRLLEPDPTKRLGSVGDGEEIRAQPFYQKINWQKVEERKMTPPFLPACDTPEAIEKRAKRGPTEDYASMLKYANGAKMTQDLFSDAFKGF
ncbi:kinase-like protein [Rhizoclosmatium globosum]|uniref:cAMP-dependent protein kinase n=1 Tax=Rhizoclosmatium globosum TaxID=329046 RepID=A0A1Y2CEM3_9FUNG|nr:kinase-like protein [Rhizoclosmatium globosum]|eukprot:ORY45510.1 kinase-like protein [Rhizoclosmatium globosum]